jgi:hypothetical protein
MDYFLSGAIRSAYNHGAGLVSGAEYRFMDDSRRGAMVNNGHLMMNDGCSMVNNDGR